MAGVSKGYHVGLLHARALREVDLAIAPGEFVAVMGPSGSGKTTLLNLAGLLEEPDTGTCRLDGIDVSRLDDDARSHLRNEKIGFVFQSFHLIHELDVFENIELPLLYREMGAAERVRRVRTVMKELGLEARARQFPAQLSGGQQQRVALARALAGGPRLLLADEPTGNLDTLMAREVMRMLERANAAGTTIVMVTHSLELARRARRTLYLLDGQLSEFAHGSRETLQAQALAG